MYIATLPPRIADQYTRRGGSREEDVCCVASRYDDDAGEEGGERERALRRACVGSLCGLHARHHCISGVEQSLLYRPPPLPPCVIIMKSMMVVCVVSPTFISIPI